MRSDKNRKKTYRPQVIADFNGLPREIAARADQLLEASLKAHRDCATFSMAVVYDLERIFKAAMPEAGYAQNDDRLVIPRYNLHYLYKGPDEIYPFELDFDAYGQVLKYALPREAYATLTALSGKEEAVRLITAYAESKAYVVNIFDARIFHNAFDDCLWWEFLLVQDRKRMQGQLVRNCRAVAVNILTAAITDYEATITKQGNMTCIGRCVYIQEQKD
ncbi:hypothetical protein LQ567_21335 [Niabella pedocola]|uniref:Uncharacterized protein n=1 Tax=Niabella pedocola TaxID=1752077 RepID=A0ABS8PW88_9BACT|nr:hypothetical protein [Niabella pedocola]MCD2425341.1 hypothetical protein [Niabella pedocola]